MSEEEAQPKTGEELLASILEVLTCLDSAIHRLESHLIGDPALDETG